MAWKGARDAAEEAGGAAAAERLRMAPREVERVVPFEGAENRHLHVFEKLGPTPEGFPRRPGNGAQAAARLTGRRQPPRGGRPRITLLRRQRSISHEFWSVKRASTRRPSTAPRTVAVAGPPKMAAQA